MAHDNDPVFTVDQVSACNTAMRTALGLPPEHVSTERFIGMISDEIEQLRVQGWDDAAIATLIAECTGSVVATESVTAFYVAPERRRGSDAG